MIFLVFLGFIYHLLAGIKKLLGEVFGVGETLKSGNLLTWIVFGLTFILSAIFLMNLVN